MPDNATPLCTIEDVRAFLQNYAEESAIVLLGRIPGFKSDKVRVLSSSESKMSVWWAIQSLVQTDLSDC